MKGKAIAALVCVLLLFAQTALSQTPPTYPILAVGSRGAEVKKMQQRLLDAGFLTGQADGVYGERTRDAVLALQNALAARGHQIKADGVSGPLTLSLLYDDEVMRPFIDLSPGAQGARVIRLQTRLYDLKFLKSAVDGVFGQKTGEALRAFQEKLIAGEAEGVLLNGILDAATRPYLDLDADLSRFHIRAPEFFDKSRPLDLTDDYLNASACVLVDAGRCQIMYAKYPDERMHPASTTKIMTLLLAVERGRLDETVTIPPSASKVALDSSLVPVYPGEKMPMRDLLYGMMMRSGNDAANAVAEICAGSVDKFVLRMNERARELGLLSTHFTNPHGYHHDNHYTTARDLAALAAAAMQNAVFYKIATALEYTMPATKKRGPLKIRNGNELLNPLSSRFYPGALGIKSGYTSKAGFCYVGAATANGQTLIAVILQSRTRNRGFDDMARLFDYGFVRLND